MDMYEFDKNRAAFPPEGLLPYRGKYIAWSPDGKRIVASDEDLLRLDDMVKELGYDPPRSFSPRSRRRSCHPSAGVMDRRMRKPYMPALAPRPVLPSEAASSIIGRSSLCV